MSDTPFPGSPLTWFRTDSFSTSKNTLNAHLPALFGSGYPAFCIGSQEEADSGPCTSQGTLTVNLIVHTPTVAPIEQSICSGSGGERASGKQGTEEARWMGLERWPGGIPNALALRKGGE